MCYLNKVFNYIYNCFFRIDQTEISLKEQDRMKKSLRKRYRRERLRQEEHDREVERLKQERYERETEITPKANYINNNTIKQLVLMNLNNLPKTIIYYYKKSIISNRVCFYCNKGDILAGGILFFRIINNTLEYLTCITKDKISDIGGKTELKDNSIYDTITREVMKETNNLFTQDFIMSLLQNNTPLYNPSGKYLLYIIELNYDISITNLHTELNSLKWRNTHELKSNLHPRLKFIENMFV